jgi:SSS family solute:Na+ symporter
MYPHSMTGVFAAKSADAIRKNAILLPAYSFLLGFIALMGYMAYAAHLKVASNNDVVPALFNALFPSWFAGVAFAAVAIGALVPAAIMSIAAANTFTRNIYKEWVKPRATREEQARVAKLMSLVVKAFALLFVFTMDKQNAINFQLLGGIWILQTFPAIVFSLYTRWFHRWALLVGWAAGMVYGTVKAYQVINPATGKHFGGSLAEIPGIGDMGYIALTAFVLNVVVAVVLTLVLNAAKVGNGTDQTLSADYFADEGDPRIDHDLDERGGLQAGRLDPA